MDLMDFREYCLSFDGVTEKTPFGKFAKRFDSILVFYVSDHIFCMVDINEFNSVTVKSTPEESEIIKSRYLSVMAPRNKALKYWLECRTDGDIPASEIMDLVARSYSLVREKYKGKK